MWGNMEKLGGKFLGIMRNMYFKMTNSGLLRCIRGSLVLMTPVLLTGSLSLMLYSLPIPAYQRLITELGAGCISSLFYSIYHAIFGLLSLYMVISVSLSYARQNMAVRPHNYGVVFTSVICFIIFSGAFSTEGIDMNVLGAQGIFTAVVCALMASSLYNAIDGRIGKRVRFYAEGTDAAFHNMIFSIVPMSIVILIFAVLNMIICQGFQVTGFHMLFTGALNRIFKNMGRSLGTAMLFELLLNLLWFFGIHGNDVLESASQSIFVPALDINAELISQGLQATEIYSKTFFDVFVLLGGCGSTLCLLIAVFLFGKRKSNRTLSKFAAVPMLFNINEIMIFGLPVVFNPLLFIPFLLVPQVLILISSLAMSAGLVPVPVCEVEWTTPILLGGYLATGSIAGSVLQVVNLAVGVLIYLPFVRLLENESLNDFSVRMERLVHILQESEESRKPVDLLALKNDAGLVARDLAGELEAQIHSGRLTVYYQPQFDNQGSCKGAEALLRWRHSFYGMIYPPLVVKLAEETDKLLELEKLVFMSVLEDMDKLLKALGSGAKISVNITGTTIQSEEIEDFLREISGKYPEYCEHIMIEITEQATLQINDVLIDRLTRIKDMGFELAIDDFSMGSTSIKYLQTNLFNLIKLDGELSRGVMNNFRCCDIITSISNLSKNLDIQVLAEYVETDEQQKILEKTGCYWYQGYLYSPAVPVEKLEQLIPEEAKHT